MQVHYFLLLYWLLTFQLVRNAWAPSDYSCCSITSSTNPEIVPRLPLGRIYLAGVNSTGGDAGADHAVRDGAGTVRRLADGGGGDGEGHHLEDGGQRATGLQAKQSTRS